MALYPLAIKRLIAPGPTDPRLDVVEGTVGHVAVSEASSLHDWFNGPSGGVESHFYIRYDGTVEQYRDTRYEADAQSQGNSWLIGGRRHGYVSYETEGMGDGLWTDAQLASIKALITWVNITHGSPWTKTPAYRGRGHGYHSQFPQWNPNGHTCPGPNRIRQFNTIIVPWLASGGKVINMPLSDADAQKVSDAFLGHAIGRTKIETGDPLTVAIALDRLYKGMLVEQAQNVALTAAVKSLAQAQGLDQNAIEAAVATAAKEALADLKITLST